MLCYTGVSVCWNYNRSGDQVLFLLYSFVFSPALVCVSDYTRCVFQCECVRMCVCVLNNYFTIFFKHDSREKFGLSWALTNWKFFQSGSETGKTSKLLRWVEFTCDFFSLLLLSLSQLWFFYSHFERSRFSDMNENACFFSVTEAFLTAQFATIFFVVVYFLYFSLAKIENERQTTEK